MSPFKVITAETTPSGGIVADRRLYLAGDRLTLREETDPDVASLLCAAGHTIPGETVKVLDLRVVDGHVVQGDAVAKIKKETEAEQAARLETESAQREEQEESLRAAKEKASEGGGAAAGAGAASGDDELASAKKGGPGGASSTPAKPAAKAKPAPKAKAGGARGRTKS